MHTVEQDLFHATHVDPFVFPDPVPFDPAALKLSAVHRNSLISTENDGEMLLYFWPGFVM